MQRIDARDPRDHKAAIIAAYVLKKFSVINMRQDKPAEHEEHVNGKIAFMKNMRVIGDIQSRKALDAIVVDDNPQRRDTAQRGQRRQLIA